MLLVLAIASLISDIVTDQLYNPQRTKEKLQQHPNYAYNRRIYCQKYWINTWEIKKNQEIRKTKSNKEEEI